MPLNNQNLEKYRIPVSQNCHFMRAAPFFPIRNGEPCNTQPGLSQYYIPGSSAIAVFDNAPDGCDSKSCPPAAARQMSHSGNKAVSIAMNSRLIRPGSEIMTIFFTFSLSIQVFRASVPDPVSNSLLFGVAGIHHPPYPALQAL